jgi:heme exporter protein D
MPYVWAAFGLTWISMGAYALIIMKRVRRAEAELALGNAEACRPEGARLASNAALELEDR